MVPIYASAQGGPGEMLITYEPVEWVLRPEPLAGVSNAYGFYIVGSSMEPAYEQGDIVLVHPGKPPIPTQHAVLVLSHREGEFTCIIKRFMKEDTEIFTLEQLNPPAGEDSKIIISRNEVQSIMKIVAVYKR